MVTTSEIIRIAIHKRILLIEDDQDITESMVAILEPEGYDVMVALKIDTNFMQFVLERKPDLILLDFLLSGRDGREICTQLKQNGSTRHIPIIMMSAHPKAFDIAKESGANSFLPKPFDIDHLLAAVRQHLQS